MRKSIFAALEEAGRRGQPEATAEHLLIVIARDDESAAAFVLDHAGVNRPRLIAAIDAEIPSGQPLPRRAEALSSFLMHVLDVARDESAMLEDHHTGTEHVLAALTKLNKRDAAQALAASGFTHDHFVRGRQAWRDQGMPRSRMRIDSSRLPRPIAKVVRLASLGWKAYGQLSLGHPKFVSDPYPLYAKLRKRWPVREDPIAPVWVVTRYADVVTVLRDPRFCKHTYQPEALPPLVRDQLGLPADRGAVIPGEPLAMLFIDPPRHTKIRAIFNRGFTPRAMSQLRPRIEQIAEKRLDRVASENQIDLMRDLAYPMPTIVIAELLGFPPEDYPKLKKWSDDFAAALTINPTVAQEAASAQSREELREYFDEVVERLKKSPGDNLISTLLTSGVEEGQLTRQEFFANCALLMAAGHETTSNLIGNGLLALLRNRDQLKQLRDDPTLMPSAVEEILRYDSPVQWNSRVATEDISLSGTTVPRGAIVLISLGSANRDPEVFKDPDRFDIRRRDNKHLAFGQGIHYCIGAALARMEAEIAIGAIVQRFPRIRLARQRTRWKPGVIFRGPCALWVFTT
ncbi:MAG: cytochrome P450 [Anaerolineae bacterium]|nr:cytochrome P450 [Phycisphaerae bacterium]